ncbi:MAG: FAD-dependent oxidoreductase [Capsulimonadales bacterium]|nr:FAD-dependent oxidoreductase [Capsulimonadales bacterium]
MIPACLCALLVAGTLSMVQTPVPPADAGPPTPARRVLDIEKRRVVAAAPRPTDTGPTCDVLIIGGGTGGVAAAEAAALRGVSVILVEPTRMLGGQFTAQLVPVPDENSHIEKHFGPSTENYRALRAQVRAHYRNQSEVIPGRENCIGSCWVSRVSGTPDVWERAIEERLFPLVSAGRIRRIYRRHALLGVTPLANGRVNYADIVDLDSGAVTRIGARFFLDATEDGQLLEVAGLPTVYGQEPQGAYSEPHAPPEPHPQRIQSFTYCFLTRWEAAPPADRVPPPAEYAYFRSFGDYTLDYVYSDARGTVPYKVLTKAPNAAGPFWTYRRLVASSNFRGRPSSPAGDIALINWRGNDFHEEAYLGRTPEEQVRVLERGRAFAQGFLHWLQTECPRDDGKGVGYPEMQPVTGETVPGVDADGMAIHPYVRESRRLKARFVLNENHLVASPERPGAKWGAEFPDSVGCALYAVDIHPAKGEPPLLFPALPYHIPLGAFLTESGPVNVLPAAKNIGATRLAMASARMHPTEWLIGEVAGALAAYCVRHDLADPAEVRENPERLAAFQTNVKGGGITPHWREILP